MRRDVGLGDVPNARSLALLLLVAIYAPFGVLHVLSPHGFLRIMPPGIPFPREVVIFTGLCEIAGAVGLLIPRTRRLAGIMLALYALCVWPANIWHALSGVSSRPCPVRGGTTARACCCSRCSSGRRCGRSA
jgi:uncharacterized membrane protein